MEVTALFCYELDIRILIFKSTANCPNATELRKKLPKLEKAIFYRAHNAALQKSILFNIFTELKKIENYLEEAASTGIYKREIVEVYSHVCDIYRVFSFTNLYDI